MYFQYTLKNLIPSQWERKMKLFFRMILIVPVGIVFLQFVGCAKKCENTSTACGSFESCCTPSNCYYTYNNKKYECDGTDCADAAQKVAADMCGTAKRLANGPLSATEQEALKKTKMLLESNAPCATCP
jgi:hypothetical protein